MEKLILVFFDISSDRIRNRVSERCKDYGLERFQFSGFCGRLSQNKIEELYLAILEEIGDAQAKVLIQPICEKCIEGALHIGETLEEVMSHPEIKIEEKSVWDTPISNILLTDY